MRSKKTEICSTCSRVKNVCQTCLLDLVYNLPVAVRDLALPAADRQVTVVPRSDATREYTAASNERKIGSGVIDAVYKQAVAADCIAENARRDEPRYERNRGRVCTFFLKNSCTRGLYCPYRHEGEEKLEIVDADDDDQKATHSLRDRYYGVNDPVAAAIIQRTCKPGVQALTAAGHAPPSDLSIRTIFVAGITGVITEQVIRTYFNVHQQHIVRVSLLHARGFGFIDFDSRKIAEIAMGKCFGKRTVAGVELDFRWGRSSARAPPARESPPAKRARVDGELA